ncbi:MAG: TolC family outer membrane protein [Alphaproteobacteria bacterium]|nr:TolC family outer membrane protein [Alphaproteobacteria bacterium]
MLGVSAALAAILLAGGAQAQSLSDTVRMTVQTNPKILSQEDNRTAVDSELRRARSLYLPQVDMRASLGPEYTENVFTPSGSNGEHIRQELSAVLTQNIYDGGARTAEVDHQLGRSRSAAYRVDENAQYVGLDAVQAHLDVVRLRHILDIADKNVQAHAEIVQRVQARSSGGAGSAASLAQALARYENAQAERDQIRGDLADAEGRYLTIVGQAPGTLEDPPVPIGMLPTDLDASIRIMRNSNPTVKAREADIESAKAGVELSDSRFDPKIDLEVGGDHNHNVGGVPGRDNEARALVVLRWNLYAGGADIHNREAAYARVEQVRTERLEALRKSEQDLRKTWAAYEAAQHRVPLLSSAAQHNSEVRTAYDQQYQLSQRSLLDLLDAQNDYFQAEINAENTQSQAVYDAYKILAIQGNLLQALNVPLPAQANPNTPTPRPVRPEGT